MENLTSTGRKICVECIERCIDGHGPCHNLKIAYPKRCSWRRTSSRSLGRLAEGSTKILSAFSLTSADGPVSLKTNSQAQRRSFRFTVFMMPFIRTSFLNVIFTTLGTIWVFPKIVDTPKWMVKIRENHGKPL